jgi:signal transduction histidine kinase
MRISPERGMSLREQKRDTAPTYSNKNPVNFSIWLTPRDRAVEHELFVLDYRNLLPHGIGQAGSSMVLAAASWGVVAHSVLWVWISWMMMTAGAYFLTLWGFRRHAKLPHSDASARQTLQRWRWMHPMMLVLTGLGWGGAGWLFVVDAPAQNFLVMTAFSGTLAYSVLSNAPYDPLGFAASAVLAMLMIAFQVPIFYGDYTPFMLSMCGMYLTVMVLAAHNARVILLQSITLRLANEKLALDNAEQARIAQRANRDKSEFLAAASHDLRQPVHALLLLIEAYRQEVPASADHPLMQHIRSAGHSIRNLFSALMELSRLESGAEKLQPTVFDLHDLLERITQRAKLEAQGKGLSLRLRMPASLDRLWLHTDKVLLERILDNLLGNALRYTQKGGVLISLRRAPREANATTRAWWLEVWDTGLGIAPADQERIFDPYVQVGNKERDRSMGLGLGLAIVKHAVALLDMRLALRSQPGKGSCFRLTIPEALWSAGSGQTLPTASEQHADLAQTIARLRGRRILLIEDDPMALQAMQALLAGWRIDLRCAQRGDESVLEQCADGWIPECVLSDFRLPGKLNGIDVLDNVLERYPSAVGILQTGELAQAIQTQAEEAGYLVLYKPLDTNVLASTLCTLLDQRARLPSKALPA